MDAPLIISVSGIRGIVGRSLTPEIACRFAAALGSHLGGGTVLVGRDSRPSGRMLVPAVVAGLLSVGCDAVDIGIVPTPTCGRAVRVNGARGAIQITASHNPAPWNGLKLFGADGAVLSAAEGQSVRERFEAAEVPRVGWDGIGTFATDTAASAEHAACVVALVDAETIRAGRFRVLLDANGGAGGPLGLALLAALGCDVVGVGTEPDGVFAHEAEPLPEHLGEIGPQVVAGGAALGFVLDPDADRLALIDETGRPIGEELTLALAACFRLSQVPGPVVINLSTSRTTADVTRIAGGTCLRSAVGEANVVELMRACGAVIGGEGNGGVIDPRVGWVRDPFIGMALILNLLALDGRPLSKVVADLPQYRIVKAKRAVDRARLPKLLAAIARHWPEAEVDWRDGLRLDLPSGWVQVRASNTEPVVRIIAEAGSEEAAHALCAEAERLLQ